LVRKHALKIVAAQGKRGMSLAHLGEEMKWKIGESQKGTLKRTLQQFPTEFSINKNGVVRLIGKQAGPGKSPLPLDPFTDSLGLGGATLEPSAAPASGPTAPESKRTNGVTSLITTEGSALSRTPGGSFVLDRHLSVVTVEGGLRSALDKISAFSMIALDCEGCQLSRTGRLCLVQVALPSTSAAVFLFDLVSMDQCTLEVLKEGLGKILAVSSITKVMHDCRQDSDALFHQLGIRLENVFDTQASYVELLRTRKEQARSASRYIILPGLNKLLRLYAGWENEGKEEGRELMDKVNRLAFIIIHSNCSKSPYI
jgi:hypothetical protein